MKKFKKFVSCLAALSLAFGAAALAACGDETDPSAVQDKIDEITDSMQSVDYKSATLSATTSIKGTSDGETLNIGAETNGTADMQTGDLDLVVKATVDEGGVKSNSTNYMFLRELNGFSYSADSVVSDWTGLTLSAGGSAEESGSAALGGLGAMELDGTAAIMLAAQLGNSYGATSTNDEAVKVDLIAMLRGIYDDVSEVVDSLGAETTISALYDADLFKNVVGALGTVIPAEDAYLIANAVLATAMGGTYSAAPSSPAITIPAPGEGISLYDYIGDLLDSTQFASSLGFGQSIGSIKVIDLINMGSSTPIAINEVKAQLNAVLDYVSFENGLTVSIPGYGSQTTIGVSRADITYHIADKVLTGVSVDVNGSVTVDEQTAVSSTQTETTTSLSVLANLEIQFSSSAASLTDLGATNVEYYDHMTGEYKIVPMGDYLDGTVDNPVDNPVDSGNVAGNTYIFDNIEVSYASDVSDEEKAMMDEYVALVKEVGQTIAFGDDGKVTITSAGIEKEGTYVQDGNTVTIIVDGAETEFKVNGNKIISEQSQDGTTLKWIYKK